MKIPVRPPTLEELLKSLAKPEHAPRIGAILTRQCGPAQGDKYYHWDKLRRLPPPGGMTSEEWWTAIKVSRAQAKRWIPLRDKTGKAFSYCTPDPVLELLHDIDVSTTGPIATSDPITNPQTKDRYIQSSLIEEAITSSQLEGASTTRQAARDMIRSGRRPQDVSERMILNNYRAIQLIGRHKEKRLTPELIFEIHETITEGTMKDGAHGPHLRTSRDGIAVYSEDPDNTLLHTPPDAAEIEERMLAMCKFANQEKTNVFLHPAIKAITLHFWLAYDHPFMDGNGRLGRALFYWGMLSQGFWLFEFLSISQILRKAPRAYGRSFLYVETDENDLTYFILAQLQVIKSAMDELHHYMDRKTDEIRQTESHLRASVSLNYRQLALLGHALRHPGMRYTIESHRRSNGMTYQTSRTDLLELQRKRLLVRSKAGSRFVFTAAENLGERLKKLR